MARESIRSFASQELRDCRIPAFVGVRWLCCEGFFQRPARVRCPQCSHSKSELAPNPNAKVTMRGPLWSNGGSGRTLYRAIQTETGVRARTAADDRPVERFSPRPGETLR